MEGSSIMGRVYIIVTIRNLLCPIEDFRTIEPLSSRVSKVSFLSITCTNLLRDASELVLINCKDSVWMEVFRKNFQKFQYQYFVQFDI